jgi:sugar O-acyltransferase (sialic acid O-acetyltransferase NeuD family)
VKPLIFWGATGQARVLRDALIGSDSTLVAIFDNRNVQSPFVDVPIFHGKSGLDEWASGYRGEPVHACVAVGGDKGADRLELLRWLDERGYPPLTVIHPRAYVASDAMLGRGCQVLVLAAVCAAARLGEAVIVNTAASIDHDCILGDGVHVGPGARLAGEVVVHECAFIGTGAIVLPRIRIGARAIIGAGAVVTTDIPDDAIVIGNPAKPRIAYTR